jgi:hypothetical protein
MTDYRLYFLNREDRIIDAADLDCDSDEQAIAEAQGYTAGYKIEVALVGFRPLPQTTLALVGFLGGGSGGVAPKRGL